MPDYRFDPHGNVSTAIFKTERHVIPLSSPYVIMLNEIPQKNSPSTMAVKEIAAVNGTSITYGTTFAEVAATPAAGQFWPDYSTNADSDKYWNTGNLLFNSADAGKFIEVSYTATGNLASINAPSVAPPWAYDRGDGSDGDFVATGNETISGVKNYKSFTIPSGVSVRVGKEPLIIKCQEAVVIDGTLNGEGNKGASTTSMSTVAKTEPVGGSGTGGYTDGSTNYPPSDGTGGGGGGRGRTVATKTLAADTWTGYGRGSKSFYLGREVADNYTSPASTDIDLMAQSLLPKAGGGGCMSDGNDATGAGGGGGGSITMAADKIDTTNGTINVSGGLKSVAVGTSSYRNCAGGSGGASIHIIAKQIILRGTISVKGGDGGDCYKAATEPTAGAAGWYKKFNTEG